MIQIEEEEIVKILSISGNQLSARLVDALQDVKASYSDNILEEHLYQLDDIMEWMDKDAIEVCEVELAEIRDLMDKYDCSYMRVIEW